MGIGCSKAETEPSDVVFEHTTKYNCSRTRSFFVENFFSQKGRHGNPNIAIQNVRLLSRSSFTKHGKICKYRECEGEHVQVENLNDDSIILFISHRWQSNTLPDDASNTQFSLIMDFLNTKEGSNVTHIWIDFSCITQDIDEDGIEIFHQQLDNIQTAVFLSDIVLVIPMVTTDFKAELQFTDLHDINDRGWCLFEAIAGLLGQCQFYLTFVAGDNVVFEKLDGGIEFGEEMSLHIIQTMMGSISQLRSYESAVGKAIMKIERPSEDVSKTENIISNWRKAGNPAESVSGVLGILQNVLEQKGDAEAKLIKRSVSLTVDIGELAMQGKVGFQLASKLPNFTCESDRAVVANLLANVGVFCLTGFEQVSTKSDEEIANLLVSNVNWELDLGNKEVLCSDLCQILQRLPEKSSYRLNFNRTSLGYCGAKMICQAKWSVSITILHLRFCQIGPVGANALADVIKTPDCSLKELDLTENGINVPGAKAIAEALKRNHSLGILYMSGNGPYDDGAEAIAESLKHNQTLITLGVEWNVISARGGAAFLEALKLNHSLRVLRFDHNPLDSNPLDESVKTALDSRLAPQF